ncbi:MAG TPA: sugar phosphate nucleotidyltransferase, partial [bacterium]|nr:sugar phosphate nucleotidyltransferase [bacterium]
LTTEIENPAGYGRIVRKEDNSVAGIVEEKDADKETKLIKEINSGIYCFDSKLLFKYLPQIKNSNSQSEYYLTDIISLMVEKKHKVCALKIKDNIEVEGINDRLQLSRLEKETYRINARTHLEKGVVISDIENTYIDCDAKIGAETVINPGSRIHYAAIGRNCIVNGTEIENCEIKDNVVIGRSRINGCIILSNVEIGNFNDISFSEIKQNSKIGSSNVLSNSKFGQNTTIQNNCSLEDIESGKDCIYSNNSAMCSFDGLNRHKSAIGDEVFIGAGCVIASPVKIGDSSYITSSSAIINDVSENCLVMSRPETIVKQGYFEKLKKKLEPSEVK